MLKEKVQYFIKIQLEDLEDFIYELDFEENYVYINFTQIFGNEISKEMAFKIIDGKLQYHSLSYGWKDMNKASNIKYFWIDLLTK